MTEQTMMVRMEKKQFIECVFAPTLFQATNGEITGLRYDIETERVDIFYGGEALKHCSVGCDSKMMCIKDIMNCIDW